MRVFQVRGSSTDALLDLTLACASSSMRSDMAADVNDFVVDAVKKFVSGVTDLFGNCAIP